MSRLIETQWLVFYSGVLAAAGPCAAPRLVAIFALTADAPRGVGLRRAACFVLGSAGAYVLLVGAFTTAARAATSTQAYWVLASLCVAAACATLRCQGRSRCEHRDEPRLLKSTTSAFLGGFFSALFGAPCCLPMLALVGLAPATTGVLLTAIAFVLGQLTPVVVAALGTRALGAGAHARPAIRRASSSVCAGLMLFLAGYYAVLA